MSDSPRIKFNGKDFNLFSWTSAMDCWSFSLPPGREGSCPSATDRLKDTICGSCYAMSGNYMFKAVIENQNLRFAWVKSQLNSDFNGFVAFMAAEIRKIVGPRGYFRWHDSGDIFDLRYAEAILEICKRLPRIRFWIPTRTNEKMGENKVLKDLCSLKNVVVRKSAIWENTAAAVGEFKQTSAVVKGDIRLDGHLVCPKSVNHTSCAAEGCRKCWHKNVKSVSYVYHGYKITDKIKARRKLFVVG